MILGAGMMNFGNLAKIVPVIYGLKISLALSSAVVLAKDLKWAKTKTSFGFARGCVRESDFAASIFPALAFHLLDSETREKMPKKGLVSRTLSYQTLPLDHQPVQ